MLPKIKALALVCLLLVLGTNALLAQLTANAGNDTTICFGDTVILGGNPTATGGTPPYTYNWGPSASISSVTISNPYTTTNVTTTYTVTVTDNLNNTATASITVTVNPLPQLDFWDSNSFNLCYGAQNGSLCVNVVGQAPPYTYAWSNGSTTQCLTSLAAGSYAVTFTDTNGCKASASTTISQPAQLLDSLHDIACNTTNGVIEAIVWGGTAPYEYQWSDGETGAGINAQVNSTYRVTITDANGCTITDTNTLHYTGLTMTIDSLHVTNVNCANANNGAICVYTSGTGTFTYRWSDFSTGQCITGLGAGTYVVSGTSSYGCTATASGTVSQPTQISVSSTVNNEPCYGQSLGSIVPTVTGGVAPYVYLWSNGATSQSITGLTAGTYYITITDSHTCTASYSATVTEPPLLVIDTILAGSATCGANDGTLSIQASGGTPGYTYAWSGGVGTGQNITGLTPGTYCLTLTDSHSCTATGCGTVTTSPGIVIDSVHVTNSTCYASNNGALCVYASGGNPFTFVWSNIATTQCITSLSANPYTVTVTNINGCSATASGIVTQPTQITQSDQVVNTDCSNVFDGSITVSVSGGVPPYTYGLNGGPFQSQNLLNGLGAGVYLVEVVDNTGCLDTLSATIQNSYAVNGHITNSTNSLCAGIVTDTITATLTGGIPPYQFSINGITWQGSNVFGVPTPGEYVVAMRDSHGCTVDIPDTIAALPPIISISVTVTNPKCFGYDSGSACALVSGGTAPYMYLWSGFLVTPCIDAMAAGTYYVTVTDINGCQILDTATITQPTQLIIDSLPVTYVTCVANNATISSYVEGGTAPYEYLWSNSATITPVTNLSTGIYTLTVIDANACGATNSAVVNQPGVVTIDSFHVSNTTCYNSANGSVCVYATGSGGSNPYIWSNAQTAQCNTSLAAGNYVVTVTSSAGCTASAAATVTQPTILKDSIAIGNCSFCDYASGGTPPYFYTWADGEITACITGLSIGTYTTTVGDANGCTVQDAAMTLSNLQFQVFTPDTNAVPDSVSLLISGGLSPYSVVWGDGQSTTEIDSETLHIYSTTGFYYLYISDSLGCTTTQYRVDAGCSDQCVWPGDANYDGVVNNNDLLAIGLGYNSTGYPRLHPTIDFIPQYCQSWIDTLMGGINYKHVDCNGDGIINAADTSAIMLNYGDTHPRNGGRSAWKSDAPGLYVSVSPDTLVDGQIATATLSLGDSAFPATNVYALAFTYNFDPLVVDTGSVNISFGNSWLAGSGDHINISKNFYGPGQVQAALTRINHINRTGQGTIATVSMKITTGNINGKNLQYYLMNNFISNLTVIDNLGNVLTFNEGADSVEIAFLPTPITPIPNPGTHIQIFPNPATDQLNITTGSTGIEDISIVDLTGQVVYRQSTGITSNVAIDISQLSSGVYMVNLKAAGREYHNRFVKINVK